MTDTIDALTHLEELARLRGRREPGAVAGAVLLELGILPHLGGFDFLKNAVLLRMEDPRKAFKKGVYPEVGRLYRPDVDARRVEERISFVIDQGWTNREEALWDRFFPQTGKPKKPTNAQFISRLARLLSVWQRCSWEN